MLRYRNHVLSVFLAGLLWAAPALADDNMLEWFNKGMHDFNQKYITSSDDGANQFFTNTIPEVLRRGLANFFANLGEPVVAVSSLAQGDIGNARIATRRFLLNLVYGYGGVLDPASQAGIKPEPRDMGQAICSIGLPDGPFLVLPFYGPSTVGSFVGSVLPILAGYAALGEAFWLLRAGNKVASTMADKDGDEAKLDKTYQFDKEHYLAARETACGRRSAVAPLAGPVPEIEGEAQLASVPR